MTDISIIIPVYNTGNKLKKTVKSVLTQSFRNIEIILVNDGSNKETKSICECLEKKDKRIRLINKKNGGLCSARNLGIKSAKGKYIAFLDHDDEFDKNLLQDNYLLAEKYKADVVKFGYKYINCYNGVINGERLSRSKIRNYMIINRDNFSDEYPILFKNKILVYIWDAIYKRSFIIDNNIFFDTQYKMGREDIAYNFNIYRYANKIVYNPKIYYKYYLYWSSTYNGIKKEKYMQFFDDILRNFKLEKNLLLDLKILDKHADYFEYRCLTVIMEIVGFLVDHAKYLTIKEIYQLIKMISFKYKINEKYMKKGFKHLKIRQKGIVMLYYYRKRYFIAVIIKIYSKIIFMLRE